MMTVQNQHEIVTHFLHSNGGDVSMQKMSEYSGALGKRRGKVREWTLIL
jgi:hypothetical protein